MQSEDATVEPEECPICFDNLTDAVITKCMHVYCAGCIHDVLATARVENDDEKKYKADERPCMCFMTEAPTKLTPRLRPLLPRTYLQGQAVQA